MIRNNKGLALTESLISAAMLGLVVFGVAELIQSANMNQVKIEARYEQEEFIRNLTDWLHSSAGCDKNLISTAPLKLEYGGAPIPVTIQSIPVLNPTSTTIDVSTGTQVNAHLRVDSVALESRTTETAANAIQVKVGANVFTRRTAVFKFDLTSTIGSSSFPTRGLRIEIPVLTDAGNNIVRCAVQTKPDEYCANFGGNWDAVAQTCLPPPSCRHMGSFATHKSCTLDAAENVISCDPDGTYLVNPLTGTGSCPPGATQYLTHSSDSQKENPGGKKGTTTIKRFTTTFYGCMICD